MATKLITKLPQFEGNPLIEIPEFISSANFLEGDFGKAFLQEYQGRVREDYNDNSALNVLSYDNGVVVGSNPFAVVLANQILRQEGLRTATPADLQKILDSNALDLRGHYEDAALVWRSTDSPNEYLARNLKEQAGERMVSPTMIHLSVLGLVNDSESPRGLTFKVTDETELIHAPILNKNLGYFNDKDVDRETGLPKKLGKEGRDFYTRQTGLSGLCLHGSLGLVSCWYGLTSSYSDGRVVVISGEATPQKVLEQSVANTQAVAERQIQEITARGKKAEHYIRTGRLE